MQSTRFFIISILAALLIACAGEPTVSSRDTQVDTSQAREPVSNILVFYLLQDDLHEFRVIVERGFTQEMKAAGIDAIAGYTRIDSVDALMKNPSGFEDQLTELGIASVLFLDPIRLDTEYDPEAEYRRRSAYRSLGMDASASASFLTSVAKDASSAKIEMNVGLWQPGNDKDFWNSTYDINAPSHQNVDNARQYAAAFAQRVIADLKLHGFVE